MHSAIKVCLSCARNNRSFMIISKLGVIFIFVKFSLQSKGLDSLSLNINVHILSRAFPVFLIVVFGRIWMFNQVATLVTWGFKGVINYL